MAEMFLLGQGMEADVAQALGNILLEGEELILGKGDEERLEQDDGFAEAGVQVKVTSVNDLPKRRRVKSRSAGNLARGFPKLGVEVLNDFEKTVRFVEELGALREQDETEQAVHAGGVLSLGTTEVLGIKRFCIGDGSVVFGVADQRTQQCSKGFGKARTEFFNDADSLNRFMELARLSILDGFVQSDAHHSIERIQVLNVGIENSGFNSG
jgi:hypothetical protein